MPVLERYRSSRIRQVAELAEQEGACFVVLSGKFGLLELHDKVPYYDYLLQPEDVPRMVDVVAEQIRQKGIDHITFFTKPTEDREELRPYIDLIEQACFAADVPFELRILEGTRMPNWREIMRKAEEAKRLLIRDRSEGEKAFDRLLQQYPSDGMVYFKRGEAWELIGELQLALRDYSKAELLFPMPKWKERARQAAERVEKQIAKLEPVSPDQILSQIRDPSLAKICGEALDANVNEPRSALVLYRTALEQVVDHLVRVNRVDCEPSTGLADKINMLRDSVAAATVSHMHTIRVLGNDAAHGEPVSPDDAVVSRTALLAILKAVFLPRQNKMSARS